MQTPRKILGQYDELAPDREIVQGLSSEDGKEALQLAVRLSSIMGKRDRFGFDADETVTLQKGVALLMSLVRTIDEVERLNMALMAEHLRVALSPDDGGRH